MSIYDRIIELQGRGGTRIELALSDILDEALREDLEVAVRNAEELGRFIVALVDFDERTIVFASAENDK